MARGSAETVRGWGISRVSRLVGRYVNHDDVLVRFIWLWVVVAAVFTAGWIMSYYLLPQGLLRGGNPAATPEFAGSVQREFLTLFGWNVGVSFIVIAANTLRSIHTPLGYVLEVVQAPRYGAVWGTGSLAIGAGERMTPSLAVLVERSGPMEITAMVAIAVATRGLMVWQQETGPRWKNHSNVYNRPGIGR